MDNEISTANGRTLQMRSLKTAAVIGRGKISGHLPSLFKSFFSYFIMLERNTSYTAINLNTIDVVILAVQDRNIESTYNQLKEFFPSTVKFIHLSGAQTFPDIIGIHPLMTFSAESKVKDYSQVPLFTDNVDFYEAYKNETKNLRFIRSDLKIKYHAMAVMLGNFSQYYLQQIKNSFPTELNFDDFKLLTLNSVKNIFKEESNGMLTGPLIRNDQETISKHKNELKHSEPALLRTYQMMESMFKQELLRNEN